MGDGDPPSSDSLESDGTGNVRSENRTRVLAAVSGGFGTIAVGLLVMAPLLPAIIADLEISPFQAGLGLSVMWGLNALGQYPGGRVSDVTGRKTVLVFGLAGFVAGFAIVTASTTFVGYLIGVGVLGLCSGTYPATGYTLLSELYGERQGRAFGIYTAFWDIGGGLSAGLAAAALATGEWRLAFPPVIVLAVATSFLIHTWNDEPYALSRVGFDVRETLERVVFGRESQRLILAFCLFFLTWQGAVSFLPTFLQSEKGLSAGLAATAFASLFLVGIVMKPISGNLGDRFGRLRTAVCALTIGAAGLVALGFAQSTWTLLGAVVLFAIGLMSVTPPLLAHVMSTLPDSSAGADVGSFRTIYMGIGSLGPAYVGFIAELSTYGVAFGGLIVSLLASATLVVSARRF
ncbi:MFS transporter [Natronobacterium texcoconense]|uniref:Predicted arabinose efflux permease, MFS family n=1 Tax=Natronobacterium texcoconense TaxID=1095778 RepID=A0A1H1FQ53_NATTX|nr:MFS transporter [Natronobacterium texcoconense]SDR03005.1 Predicted arabinose efflux permease, MFS family [Natronobacterium texcoconense]